MKILNNQQKISIFIVFLLFFSFMFVNTALADNFSLTLILKGEHPAGSSIEANVPSNGACSATTDSETICVTQGVKDSSVKVSQTSAADALFVKWGGDCQTSGALCEFTMDTNKTVSAEFKKATVISNNNNNNGNGTVNATNNSGGNNNQIEIAKPTVLNNGGLVHCQENCGWNQLIELVNTVINFVLFVLAIPIAAIMFAYAGILLLFSGGNSEQKSKASDIFFNVVKGLATAGAAWLIVHVILLVLGYTDASWIGF